MRILLAIILVVCAIFVGLVLGAILDDYFGGVSWSFSPVLAVVLPIASLIVYFLKNKSKDKNQ